MYWRVQKWRSGGDGRRNDNADSASLLRENAGEHACRREECVVKGERDMFGADEKRKGGDIIICESAKGEQWKDRKCRSSEGLRKCESCAAAAWLKGNRGERSCGRSR